MINLDMLSKKQVTKLKSHEAQTLYAIYQTSFPKRELKDLNELFAGVPSAQSEAAAAANNAQIFTKQYCEHYLYFLKEKPDEAVAAVSLWYFSAEVFIEYLAVAPAFRNQNLGQQILTDLQQANPSLLLEIEVPEEEMSQRRFGFYRRCGFVLQSTNYVMPGLARDQEHLPMWLLRWPNKNRAISDPALEEQIHNIVYGQTNE